MDNKSLLDTIRSTMASSEVEGAVRSNKEADFAELHVPEDENLPGNEDTDSQSNDELPISENIALTGEVIQLRARYEKTLEALADCVSKSSAKTAFFREFSRFAKRYGGRAYINHALYTKLFYDDFLDTFEDHEDAPEGPEGIEENLNTAYGKKYTPELQPVIELLGEIINKSPRKNELIRLMRESTHLKKLRDEKSDYRTIGPVFLELFMNLPYNPAHIGKDETGSETVEEAFSLTPNDEPRQRPEWRQRERSDVGGVKGPQKWGIKINGKTWVKGQSPVEFFKKDVAAKAAAKISASGKKAEVVVLESVGITEDIEAEFKKLKSDAEVEKFVKKHGLRPLMSTLRPGEIKLGFKNELNGKKVIYGLDNDGDIIKITGTPSSPKVITL